MFIRVALITTVLAGVLSLGAAAAPQAQAPPGAQISSSLEYVARVPGTQMVVEGKFDRARGRDLLIVTGRFGFKTLDVSDPTSPVAPIIATLTLRTLPGAAPVRSARDAGGRHSGRSFRR